MESSAFLKIDDDVVTEGQKTQKHELTSSKTSVDIISKCPYIATPTIVAYVQKLHDILNEIFSELKQNVEHLGL